MMTREIVRTAHYQLHRTAALSLRAVCPLAKIRDNGRGVLPVSPLPSSHKLGLKRDIYPKGIKFEQ
jgi:hypothetical protein